MTGENFMYALAGVLAGGTLIFFVTRAHYKRMLDVREKWWKHGPR